jgi:pyruvate dehydrogenase E2 component (dihydrolipoamide acetyltransferase)
MSTFNMPDLGEGLQEAELVSWHVSAGDHVVADQPLLSVETAKAVVEVPSPRSGRIARLFGAPGDIIKVGAPIVEFAEEARPDTGTVVGVLPRAPAAAKEAPRRAEAPEHPTAKASPAARALARDLGVDLQSIAGTGPGGTITRADIEAEARALRPSEGYEPLRSVRRAMAESMARSALEVPGSTVTDEVAVGHWREDTDVTVRLIRAIVAACRAEPALNAWFDKTRMARKLHARIDLGIAVNTGDGLFAPVLRDVAARSEPELRASLEALKRDVAARKVAPAALSGQTITLSNFGMLGGRDAALAIVPPQVAILGAGRIFAAVRPVDDKISVTKVLPLSLTFDHRVVTGAEAVRFLNAIIASLAASR